MNNLSTILTDNPDYIYLLLDKIQNEIKEIFPFGPANTHHRENTYLSLDPECIKSLKFPSHLCREDRWILISREKYKNSFNYEIPYIDRFIQGTGVCTEFNFFALMILAKQYDFEAILENIHSDEMHTYIVLQDTKKQRFILDFWYNSALIDKENCDWNEAMPFEFARKSDYKISIQDKLSSTYLRSLWPQLNTPQVREAKQQYFAEVMCMVDQSFSSRYHFFQSRHTDYCDNSEKSYLEAGGMTLS
jgi:hypothetical protein